MLMAQYYALSRVYSFIVISAFAYLRIFAFEFLNIQFDDVEKINLVLEGVNLFVVTTSPRQLEYFEQAEQSCCAPTLHVASFFNLV